MHAWHVGSTKLHTSSSFVSHNNEWVKDKPVYPRQAVGFALVPLMPSVWSLTALYFVICFSYNFTNSAVFTSLGWMFPRRAGGALNLVRACL